MIRFAFMGYVIDWFSVSTNVVVILFSPILYFVVRKKRYRVVGLTVFAFFIYNMVTNYDMYNNSLLPKQYFEGYKIESIITSITIGIGLIFSFTKRRKKRTQESEVLDSDI